MYDMMKIYETQREWRVDNGIESSSLLRSFSCSFVSICALSDVLLVRKFEIWNFGITCNTFQFCLQ